MNQNTQMYQDIANRTQGDIYIGVVGPVRAGKSTFIKRFMETQVIPNMENVYSRERAKDELPQSGSGRMVMTSEPKFVPEEAVEISLGEGASCSVRLIDCVGYMIPGAVDRPDGEMPRMVTTPWSDQEVTMAQAAEIGTTKVIREHSTIGIVVTTDGTILDIPREEYKQAEGRVIDELKSIGKPFIVLVNSLAPESQIAQQTAQEIAEQYGVQAMAVNCQTLSDESVSDILKCVLYEFPLTKLSVFLPKWVEALDNAHPIKRSLYASVREAAKGICRVFDVSGTVSSLQACEQVSASKVDRIDLGSGCAEVSVEVPRSLFYQTLSEQSGVPLCDDGDLLKALAELSAAKKQYDKVAEALQQARESGYGVVMPSEEDLDLQEPEIMKQGGRYGVKLRASAPSIHMIRADIEATVSPIVGNEKQSEDMVEYLLKEFEGDTGKIWQSNIFGRSFYEIVNEDLQSKLKRMPQDAQQKMRQTLERIINEGGGGLICIIL